MSKRYLTMRLVALPASPTPAPPPPPLPPPPPPVADDPVSRWAAAARTATDPCLVVDAHGMVAALSPPAATMLGHGPETAGSRLDDVLVLLDFNDSNRMAPPVGRRVPPLVAVNEGQLSRGVLRVRGPEGRPLMLDAVATPLHDAFDRVVGALSFFVAV